MKALISIFVMLAFTASTLYPLTSFAKYRTTNCVCSYGHTRKGDTCKAKKHIKGVSGSYKLSKSCK